MVASGNVCLAGRYLGECAFGEVRGDSVEGLGHFFGKRFDLGAIARVASLVELLGKLANVLDLILWLRPVDEQRSKMTGCADGNRRQTQKGKVGQGFVGALASPNHGPGHEKGRQ